MSRFMSFIGGIGAQLIVKKPKLGVYGYNLKNDSHETHQQLLDKIEKLWRKLEQHRNSEAVQIQTQIEHNRRRIEQLTRDNIFELEVQTADQRVFLRAKITNQKMV